MNCCKESALEILPPVFIMTFHPVNRVDCLSVSHVSSTQGLDVGEKPDSMVLRFLASNQSAAGLKQPLALVRGPVCHWVSASVPKVGSGRAGLRQSGRPALFPTGQCSPCWCSQICLVGPDGHVGALGGGASPHVLPGRGLHPGSTSSRGLCHPPPAAPSTLLTWPSPFGFALLPAACGQRVPSGGVPRGVSSQATAEGLLLSWVCCRQGCVAVAALVSSAILMASSVFVTMAPVWPRGASAI